MTSTELLTLIAQIAAAVAQQLPGVPYATLIGIATAAVLHMIQSIQAAKAARGDKSAVTLQDFDHLLAVLTGDAPAQLEARADAQAANAEATK